MSETMEPNDAMVEEGASSAWEETNPGILGWNSISERHKEGCRRDARTILRAALNHPDAAGLFAGVDARPWEPLGEHDPLYVGDEVRQELNGVTTIAVVGRVDVEGDPWTTEDRFIGVHDEGTWYVRRAGQELPTEEGAVIVPAEGREFIEAEVAGQTYIAREAVVCQSDFGPSNVLEGAWRRADTGARVGGQVSRDFITPGTWKVDGEDSA